MNFKISSSLLHAHLFLALTSIIMLHFPSFFASISLIHSKLTNKIVICTIKCIKRENKWFINPNRLHMNQRFMINFCVIWCVNILCFVSFYFRISRLYSCCALFFLHRCLTIWITPFMRNWIRKQIILHQLLEKWISKRTKIFFFGLLFIFNACELMNIEWKKLCL